MPGAASKKRATSSGLRTTGILRGSCMNDRCLVRSGSAAPSSGAQARRRSTPPSRKFAAKTQHDYVQRVKDFAAFLGRCPDTAESEDERRFRLHLTSSGVLCCMTTMVVLRPQG